MRISIVSSSDYKSMRRVSINYHRSANRRPIFPKQTQLQNITLAIHVATPIVSFVIIPLKSSPFDVFAALALGEGVAGEGTIPGLTPSNTAVPVRPTTVERTKPGLERSMRYHKTGFASASVRETWSVDCQGSLRYRATHQKSFSTFMNEDDPDSQWRKRSQQKHLCYEQQDSNPLPSRYRPAKKVSHHSHCP